MNVDALPCGRDPLDVWDHAAEDHLTSHEQTCPYCQGVVGEHRALAEPTRQWRSEAVAAPPALLERVMANVRSTLRARNYLPLVSAYGPVQLDTATAAGVLRWVVDQVDGARARSCQLQVVPAVTDAGDEDPPPPIATVGVHLSVTVRAGTSFPALAEQIRSLVRTVGEELLGIAVATVDIDIVDLFDHDPALLPRPPGPEEPETA